MVGDVKDWQVIFRQDIKRANKLQKEYEELIKKFRTLKKHQISDEKRKQVDMLIYNIKIKLDNVKQIEDQQHFIMENYCGYPLIKSLT